MLAIAVTFFRPDQFLKDAPDDIRRNFRKIDGCNVGEQAPPGIQRIRRLKDERRSPIFRIGHQERFIITAPLDGSLKKPIQRRDGVPGALNRRPEFEPRQLRKSGDEGFIKDEPIGPDIG